MYRHLLINVNSKEIFQFLRGSIQYLNVLIYEFSFKEFYVYFKKLLVDDRISTNIDINERLCTGSFGANGTSLYTGTGFYI